MNLTDTVFNTVDYLSIKSLKNSGRLNELLVCNSTNVLTEQQTADAKLILKHADQFDAIDIDHACRLFPDEINHLWSLRNASIVLEHLTKLGQVPLTTFEQFNSRSSVDQSFLLLQFFVVYQRIMDPVERAPYTNFLKQLIHCPERKEITLALLRQNGLETAATLLQHDLFAGQNIDILRSIWPLTSTNTPALISMASSFIAKDDNRYEKPYFELIYRCHLAGTLQNAQLQEDLFWYCWHNDDLDRVQTLYPDYRTLAEKLRCHHISATNLFAQLSPSAKTPLNDNYFQDDPKNYLWRLMNEILLENTNDEDKKQLSELACNTCDQLDDFSMMFAMLYPTWHATDQTPYPLSHAITHSKTLTPMKVLEAVGNLRIKDVVRRNAFASALLETAILGHAAQHVCATVAQESPCECAACYTAIETGEEYIKMSKSCEATLCMDCAPNSLANLTQGNQCQWNCACQIHSETAIALNASEEAVLTLRQATVDQFFNTQSQWVPCSDVDCVGGHMSPETPTTSQKLYATVLSLFYDNTTETQENCTLCLRPDRFSQAAVATLKADLATVRLLLDDIGTVGGQYNGEGMIRECFHCGITVQKDKKCATVTCLNDSGANRNAKGCGRQFDFVGGSRAPRRVNPHHFYYKNAMPGQQYIPTQNSLLWQKGFYSTERRCQPRSHNPLVMRTIIAEKESWFAKFESNTNREIKAQLAGEHTTAQAQLQPGLNSAYSPNLYFNPNHKATIRDFQTGDLVCFPVAEKWQHGKIVKFSTFYDWATIEDETGRQHKVDFMKHFQQIVPYGAMPVLAKNLIRGEKIEIRPKKGLFQRRKPQWQEATFLSRDGSTLNIEYGQNGKTVSLKESQVIISAKGTHKRGIIP